ncbi:MAG TPA: glycosyltransferase family 2 protein [Thermoanaerobaculia bacterium]|nr:glycosyltransferase family 2 protein [Thermoanaerobaculia bacterium]
MTTSSKPRVSVVMPVRNEAAFIRHSAGALLQQDYPGELLEIIVADGGSDDATREILDSLAREQAAPRLRIIDNPERIFSTGFNRGVAAADGEVIVMMGGHTVVAHDYVSEAVKALEASGADCVGGFIETVAMDAASEPIALAMASKFGVGGVAFRTVRDELRDVDTVAFGAYRRATLDALGPLDEELVRNQDDELNYRLRGRGGRILLVPSIRSRYHSRSSLRTLARQYFWYGYWKVRVMQKHPLQMRWRHFVPPLFVASLVTAAAIAPLTVWPLVLLSGAYVAAALSAAVVVAATAGWSHILKLPLIFATLHLGYGAGFLLGLVRFAHRWRRAAPPPTR